MDQPPYDTEYLDQIAIRRIMDALQDVHAKMLRDEVEKIVRNGTVFDIEADHLLLIAKGMLRNGNNALTILKKCSRDQSLRVF